MGWVLEDIFASDSEFRKCVRAVRKDADDLFASLVQIKDGRDLTVFLGALERLCILYEKADVYLKSKLLLDGTDKKAASEEQELVLIFSKLEILKNTVMYEYASKYSYDPQCVGYSCFLKKLNEKLRHCGKREAEDLFADIRSVSKNWRVLHNANLAKTKAPDPAPVSLAIAIANQLNDDPKVRRNGYLGEQNICGSASEISRFALCSIKSENIIEARMRGFSSVLEMCLHQDGIDPDCFGHILEAAKRAADMARKCFNVRQRLLGGGSPKWYNLNYVISGKGEKLSWDTVLDAIKQMGRKVGGVIDKTIQRAIAENWIDHEARPNKRSGACCNSLHAQKATYIMLTFSGSVKGYVSLSHELGHAVHHTLLQENNYFDSFAAMPVNEAIAVFFELIAGDELASLCPQHANAITESRINALISTFLEVQSRFLFEKDLFLICESRLPGKEELYGLALSAQKRVFGDTGDDESYHPYIWVSKPHFYYQDIPFYNYPYIIARLIAYALYGRCLEEGTEAFFNRLLPILAQSGKHNVREVLLMLDTDENDCWRTSLKNMQRIIDQWNMRLMSTKI